MEKRQLGNSGIKVAPLAFGGNVFGWTLDEANSFKLLDAFVDSGCHLIDTADVYSRWIPGNQGGESETIIGKWLKHSGKRNKVIIATKVGMEMGPGKKGLSKARIFAAIEESLRRLQVDVIDLYQSHTDDQETPLEETLEAYGQLQRQGKIRAIGASNYTGERLARALEISRQHGYPAYQCLQPLYNLYDRTDYEKDLEPVCRKHHLGVIPYFSLASGFLTGKYRTKNDMSKGARGPRVERYMNERGMRVLTALDHVAEQLQTKPASVALAWLMAQPSITAPIASATNLDQWQDLLAATRLTLDAKALDILNTASAES